MNIEIGNFYYAKIYIKYNNHMRKNKEYKIRPVLVIGKVGKFYKCLACTTLLRDGYHIDMTRFDYMLDKHSQIICNTDVLVDNKNFYSYIKTCDNEDFNYILSKREELKNKKSSNFISIYF